MDLASLEITSERLRLVPISLDFTTQIFEEFTPTVTYFMYPKSPENIEDTKRFISKLLERLRAGSHLQMVVLDKQTGEFLGYAGLYGIDTSTPEFGIWIKVAAWSKGYGKEAIIALKQWADENVAYEYIKYPVDRRNIASRKIPEFLGGVIAREYRDTSESGKPLNLVEYRIYRSKAAPRTE